MLTTLRIIFDYICGLLVRSFILLHLLLIPAMVVWPHNSAQVAMIVNSYAKTGINLVLIGTFNAALSIRSFLGM